MEYVYSKNFIGYFETAGFEQISYFVKAFILFIEKELQVSPLQCIPADVLRQKYRDVQDKIGTNPLLTGDKDIQNIIKQSMRIFSMPNDILIPVGICHGDLTFSNMLFKMCIRDRGSGKKQIEPGCEIIIPSKAKKRTNMGDILGYATSFSSLGMMIASIANLIKK